MINRYYDPSTGQFISVDPMLNETDQAYAYAGDDPVDGVDPTGLCTLPNGTYYPGNCASNGPQAIAAENWTQSQGGGWSLTQAVHSELNYLAGVGNGIVSTVTFGQVHVSAPYCGALRWAYGVGSGIGYAGMTVAVAIGVKAIAGNGPYDEVGAVGRGSPALDPANADMTVQEYASTFMNGTNARQIPGEFMDMTVKEALESGNTTVRKLLTNLRFQKG
jgi:hypothetical protein